MANWKSMPQEMFNANIRTFLNRDETAKLATVRSAEVEAFEDDYELSCTKKTHGGLSCLPVMQNMKTPDQCQSYCGDIKVNSVEQTVKHLIDILSQGVRVEQFKKQFTRLHVSEIKKKQRQAKSLSKFPKITPTQKRSVSTTPASRQQTGMRNFRFLSLNVTGDPRYLHRTAYIRNSKTRNYDMDDDDGDHGYFVINTHLTTVPLTSDIGKTFVQTPEFRCLHGNCVLTFEFVAEIDDSFPNQLKSWQIERVTPIQPNFRSKLFDLSISDMKFPKREINDQNMLLLLHIPFVMDNVHTFEIVLEDPRFDRELFATEQGRIRAMNRDRQHKAEINQLLSRQHIWDTENNRRSFFVSEDDVKRYLTDTLGMEFSDVPSSPIGFHQAQTYHFISDDDSD